MQKRLKSIGKNFLCGVLENQVTELRRINEFKIIAVTGSVGKTSTKLAVARTLEHKSRVVYQVGNYNDRLTVPLVLFGHAEPGIFNILAWLRILNDNRRQLKKPYPYDIAVLELGTDGPGQLQDFEYLQPDITLLTSVAAEHMEYFGTLDAVAEEEVIPLSFSRHGLINLEDVASEYMPESNHIEYYGTDQLATYQLTKRTQHELTGQTIHLKLEQTELAAKLRLQGEQGAKAGLAAAAVASLLDWSPQDITEGLARVEPVAGRMQILEGIKDTTLIDDTYNASPIAVRAALSTLYSTKAPQRIAILGTMNELGDVSEEEHEAIGDYCDPDKLDLVVTIGEKAKEYIARNAEQAGCRVQACMSPYEAGEYVQRHLKPGAIVLAKGSQNGVFAEEALKVLLKNPKDVQKLVRQSAYWLDVKARQFPPIN